MELNLRNALEELAAKLHLTHETGEADTEALQADVRKAIDSDEHEGLGERLQEAEVELEASHPDLAEFIRQLVDRLSAAGL
jgi:hypothetical protein